MNKYWLFNESHNNILEIGNAIKLIIEDLDKLFESYTKSNCNIEKDTLREKIENLESDLIQRIMINKEMYSVLYKTLAVELAID